MTSFGFDTLALLVVVGLTGPLLAALPRLRIPLIVGEIGAGIVIGQSGLRLVDHTDATLTLLANVGFALVMFVVGTHVPVRDATLRSGLPAAVLRTVVVGAAAAAGGALLSQAFGTGHAALYAVLMASSSAALALPVIDQLGLDGAPVLSVTAQIAIADTAAIILLPLVLHPQDVPRTALGVLALAACAVVVYVLLRAVDRRRLRKRMHQYSRRRQLALELRISLVLLFGMCALAVNTHVSIMLAGFALGLVVAAVGEPRRLARQLFGITEGFFGPLFFVWLGASLPVRELLDRPGLILLGLALGGGAVLAHLSGLVTGQPAVLGVLASAQLGVPVAAAALGAEQHLLVPGEASAMMLGALVTVVCASVAAALAARTRPAAPKTTGTPATPPQ